MGFLLCLKGTRNYKISPMEQDMLQGKKAIIFGERDDISGTTIRTCLVAAGAEVVYESTACFV